MVQHRHHHHLTTVLIGTCLCARSLAFSGLPCPLSRVASIDGSSTLLRLTDGDEGARPVASTRRSALLQSASFLLASTTISAPANAGIDPNALKSFKVEGDDTGMATRLRQIESVNGPRPDDSKDIAFDVLPSGVSFREYREGKGDATVQQGSKVAVEMTIRAKSFATADEPGGRKYFSTKTDTDFNELAWTVGSGELPPELEEAMIGMRKSALRRIELPSTAVFAAQKNEQLPSPSANNKEGKRVYDRLFKTDATSLFEVLLTRIK